jgi:hypothetical protein
VSLTLGTRAGPGWWGTCQGGAGGGGLIANALIALVATAPCRIAAAMSAREGRRIVQSGPAASGAAPHCDLGG